MIKILFVCHGNICRSPMAEFIMKDLVKKASCTDMFEIASAATSTEALGCRVYSPARKELLKHGLTCDGKTSRQMNKDDYGYYDYIVAMDKRNLRNMVCFIGDDPNKKVSLLMDYTDSPGDVADPWYTDDFTTTWNDILKGCEGLLDFVLKKQRK